MPSVAQVRKGFAEYVNRVAYGGERVLVERRGRPTVALIDMTDYQILLDHEGRQDRADVAEAARILAHPERHRWQTLEGEPVPPPAPSRAPKLERRRSEKPVPSFVVAKKAKVAVGRR